MCTFEMAQRMAAVTGGDRENDLGVQWVQRMEAARNLGAAAAPTEAIPPGGTPAVAAPPRPREGTGGGAAPRRAAYPIGTASGQFVGEQDMPLVTSIVPAGQFVGEVDMPPRPMGPPSGQFMGDAELRMAPYPMLPAGQFTGEPMNTIIVEPPPLPLPPRAVTQQDIDRADAFEALRASREAEAARRGQAQRMPALAPPPFVAEPPPEFVPTPAQPRGVPPRPPRLQMLSPPRVVPTPDYALPMPTPAPAPPPRR